MTHHCICCKQPQEDQFISKYETLNRQEYIRICESCFEEHSEFDNELNLPYIMFGNDFYLSENIEDL